MRKYIDILPYHAAAFGTTFVLDFIQKQSTLGQLIEKCLLSLPEFFLIHMSGICNGKGIVIVDWYLSSMFFGMLFMYPLLRKCYDLYVFTIGPILSFSILGYLYIHFGYLQVQFIWDDCGVITNGNLRAIALMSLGSLAYEMAKAIQKRDWTTAQRLLLTLVCLLGYGITIGFTLSDMSEKVRFTLLFLLMFSVAISFSGKTLYGKYMDNDVVRFIGKLSLPLYLNTNMIRVFMKMTKLNQLRYRYHLLIAIVLDFVLSYLMVIIVEKIRSSKRNKAVLIRHRDKE